MGPFTESGLASARKRLAKAISELRKATKCDPGDPLVWLYLGEALMEAMHADAQIADAMKLEGMATVDTQRPEGGQ